ncbi:MAG: bifunctional homocysteine S-methyltransferase/methylenetetrahydrofolate reductase, partial [Gemmatimonadota bacterium]|nr:bifunctional homocysteine S-methyltransferase/methylenetetrahydrofolate reductase [Gemmatimonadota bacterium]
LSRGVLVGDGAMGTMLYAKGVYINRCFDELNLTEPDLVRGVHSGYVEAGADFLETNTFGANTFKLEPHGLGDRVPEINRQGAEIAREAAGEEVLVAGAIGPLGVPIEPIGRIAFEEARAGFRDQAEALAEGGADFLIMETFHRLEEMREAIRGAREATDLPLVAQMTLTEENATALGDPAAQVAARLEEWGADVVGLNCSVGPRPMLKALEVVREYTARPLSVMPNAGMPRLVEGRYLYLSSPDYFAKYARRFFQAGAKIVGGCCGTTPDHIRAVAAAARAIPRKTAALEPARTPVRLSPKVLPEAKAVPSRAKSAFAEALASGRFAVSVEVSPPRGPDPARVLERIRLLEEAGVDAVNIPDGPRASARMSSLALAVLAGQETGIEVILHYCCRDRNLLGMQSDLLGAGPLGIRNLLIVTGDPPKMGDYPDATAVFDVDSIGLLQIAGRLNHGQDIAGNPMSQPTALHLGVGVNPAAVNLDEEVRRFEYKVEAGAEYALTQPVYDVSVLERFIRRTEHCRIPTLAGILPLRSHRNAEFLSNEVPGMEVPRSILDRMKAAPTGAEGREEGIAIAKEALRECAPMVQGVYVMPPFGKIDVALEVVAAVPPELRAPKQGM